jgi:hypothetical protein
MTAPKNNDNTRDFNSVSVESTALFAFIGELERLKHQAEQRGGDLMLPLSQREANKAGASAYTFCQIRIRAIISQANANMEAPNA